MTAKTSRIIIKTFVKTALKDADESPERCTRNLVDMALHFSKGRFQQEFFEMARAMLNNENSPYYPLIEDTLRHMNKDKLIEFGMNLGYNGCTMGAHIVRKLKRTENINVPWLFFLNIDSSCEDLLSRYQPIFDQGKELGIYVYFLYADKEPEKLLPLIANNPDCAMILLCDSASVTEDFADAAESLDNMLIGIAYDDSTDSACLVLRDHRLLYSVYWIYTDEESEEILSGSYARFAEEMHCPFVAVLADSNCSTPVRENVYKAVVGARVAQKYRTIPLDLIYDIERVGNIISPPSSVIGFRPDGTLYNTAHNGEPMSHNVFKESLRDILKESFSMDTDEIQ
ncbi:hypothetical protein [Blautia sp. MSJ-19]|uniref:hypothetical protein n=1 Tax=Blautia sp. MSJ-19 TaxID=2841517 RepID=UPI001C0EDFD9|nr:hypothetical protein [Blautia sp. MSJ-19]MBU5480763.1 hypothetical protein [Blautia sp. MSJ-19]